MGEVAVKDGFLDEQEYLSLSESTGRKIKADYPVLVDGIALSDEAIKRASPGSNCSQILVALTKGME